MAAKIAALIITLLINIAIGIVILFFMVVAMNGFTGSDAEKGLIAYIALAVVVTVLMGTGAYVATHLLLKRQINSALAVAIAVPIFVIVGAGLKFVCSIIGIAVAEYVRVNY